MDVQIHFFISFIVENKNKIVCLPIIYHSKIYQPTYLFNESVLQIIFFPLQVQATNNTFLK